MGVKRREAHLDECMNAFGQYRKVPKKSSNTVDEIRHGRVNVGRVKGSAKPQKRESEAGAKGTRVRRGTLDPRSTQPSVPCTTPSAGSKRRRARSSTERKPATKPKLEHERSSEDRIIASLMELREAVASRLRTMSAESQRARKDKVDL